MAYEKQTWENLPTKTTPITAERLTHIEDGIYDNSLEIEDLWQEDEDLKEIMDLIPYMEDEGTSISFDNTAQARLRKIELKGNTYQYSTTGKNLLPLNIISSQTSGSLTITNLGDGTLKLNGTNSNQYIDISYNYELQANVEYKWVNLNTLSGSDGNVSFRDNSNNSITYIGLANASNTYTPTSNKQVAKMRLFFGTTTFNNYIVKIMLIKSTDTETWEKYTGGTTSPNPDYPQDIQVVSGDNTIKVEGKNLFDKNKATNGYRIGPDGEPLSATGYSLSSFIKVLPNTTYVRNLGISKNNAVALYDSNKTFISRLTSGTSFTTTNETYYVRTSIITTSLDELQLEKGNTETTYTPYVSQTYPIYLGVENLFESEYIYPTSEISINAHLTKGTYTLSLEDKSNFGAIVYIQLYNGDTLITTSGHITNANSTISFSTSSYWYYLGTSDVSYLTFTIDNNYNLKIAFANATSTQKAQLEKGSKANHYTPYGTTPIELCKIGDYQDYFYKDSGKWYLHKEIGKVVLNGSENWQDRPNYNTWDRFVLQTTTIPIQTVKGYSQYFKVNFIPNDGLGYIFENVGTQIGCNFSVKGTTTLAQFKEWLSTHNTTVYYVLATPTYTQITDNTLIGQLNALEKAKSYNEQTNINQENNDYSFIINASAYYDLKELLTRVAELEVE